MMTSINPKGVNINYTSNPAQDNNLFQKNNFGSNREPLEKYKYNTNFNNGNQNNILKPNDNISTNNLNYPKQNNSGLQSKKNYSTPILNEVKGNQDTKYKRSLGFYDKTQQNQNMLNQNQMDSQNNQITGNDNDYMMEIEKLKMQINNLKKSNDNLNSQLMDEKRKNQQLQNSKGEEENSILSSIAQCIQVSSFDEILPKLNDIINFLNKNAGAMSKKNNSSDDKMKDELIAKLQKLYLNLTGSNQKKEEVTIKILWRWIKHLINTVKQLALEKEKNIEIYQNMQDIDEYKEYCEELINGFNLQSLEELKMFIDSLLKQSNLIKENEPQEEMENYQKGNMQMNQKRGFPQGQNYQQEEENEEGEEMVEGEMEEGGEGEEEGGEGEMEGEYEVEGEEEGIDEENNDGEQYDNEIMQKQMNMPKN